MKAKQLKMIIHTLTNVELHAILVLQEPGSKKMKLINDELLRREAEDYADEILSPSFPIRKRLDKAN